ncbi:Uncharacterised protein [Slackia heliotrinireducens]|uniref:Uncharacterized protein n=1 Tax=Slackia heliotrinireducens (strain ATCC 29202 / DSM 20476 / NCTC 11029 / RHS 1) TaxID=471855 RepID=C7N6H8_SLAHD|nr:hypothetical protein [Slackia heliotrinireducens]ACV22513.1 hypothetical protein Shel_14930 [Slackia heliotrinireducens DSM 20476]VEH00941.1 Uncharacterised protein [Slackia heliotrinireducens]
MSGPKTSQLEIERQMRARMQAARDRAETASVSFRHELQLLLSQFALCTDEDISAQVNAIVAQLESEFESELSKALDNNDVDVLEAACSKLTHLADSLAFDAKQRFAPLLAAEKALRRSTDLQTSLKAFSRTMADHDSDDAGLMESLELLKAFKPQSPAESGRTAAAAESEEDIQERFAAMLDGVRTAIASPFTLEKDRAVMVGMAQDIVGISGPDAQKAASVLAQYELIAPAVAARAERMQELAARMSVIEAELKGSAPRRPAGFSNLDEAVRHLDNLKHLAQRRREERYVHEAIDTIMRRHGYDVARSVELGAVQGSHTLFSGDAKDTGIHAFLSDSGDMMLEVVGLGAPAPAESGTSITAVTDDDDIAHLFNAQNEFCAVYAEIEEELAAMGIRNAVRYKAAPDVAHCKQIHLASDQSDFSADTQIGLADDRRRRDQVQQRAREMR